MKADIVLMPFYILLHIFSHSKVPTPHLLHICARIYILVGVKLYSQRITEYCKFLAQCTAGCALQPLLGGGGGSVEQCLYEHK
jgi:hypothetical protein